MCAANLALFNVVGPSAKFAYQAVGASKSIECQSFIWRGRIERTRLVSSGSACPTRIRTRRYEFKYIRGAEEAKRLAGFLEITGFPEVGKCYVSMEMDSSF